MKSPLFLLSLAATAVQAQPTLEALKSGALDLPAISARFSRRPAPSVPPGSRDPGPILEIKQPRLLPALPREPLTGEVARMTLALQLERHGDLLTKQLGGGSWRISLAGDAKFENYFLTFRQGEKLLFRPIGSLDRLRGDGVDVTIEPGLAYNFRLSVSLLNPVRGSTLHIRPLAATRGPAHAIKTGELLDALKARSFVFSYRGVEYWTLYGTDVDARTNGPGDSRSLLFIRLNGLNSQGWPVAEASLPVDQPIAASLASPVVLTRTAAALLVGAL